MTNITALQIQVPAVTEITDAWVPHRVHIPLYCRELDETMPEIGSCVREGDVLRSARDGHPAVMSTVPGEIMAYREMPLYDGGRSLYAVIRTDGAFTYFGHTRKKKTVQTLTALELSTILNRNGVFNTFDHAVPFADQVRTFQKQIHIDDDDRHDTSVTVLCVRFFDEDPVSLTGQMFAEHYYEDIQEGIRTLADVINASYVYVFYPARSQFFQKEQSIPGITRANVQFLPVNTEKYPCGRERDLRKQMKKAGFSHNDDRLLFVDSQTVYATALAALYNLPVLETLVQINGSALKKDRIFKTRIGTPIGELVAQCDGLKRQPRKLLINGLIRGYALAESEVPVTSQVLSVTVPAASDVPDCRQVHCIRCGRCHRACAAGIHPDKLLFAYMNRKDLTERLRNTVLLCNDCRECNTSCPARLPLSQTIQLLREGLTHE